MIDSPVRKLTEDEKRELREESRWILHKEACYKLYRASGEYSWVNKKHTEGPCRGPGPHDKGEKE